MKDLNYSIDRIILNKKRSDLAACNQMAAHGTCDIMELFSSEVWVTKDDINDVQKIFDDNTDIHILGPKQRDEYGLIRHAGIVGSNIQPKHRGWNQADQKDELYKDRVP